MGQTFSERLREWIGARTQSEGAELLGIPLPTFRKYIYGEREPTPLGLVELERRMAAVTTNDGKKDQVAKEAGKAPGRTGNAR